MSEKLDGLSMDIAAAEQEKLRAVFPQCFTDGKLDERKLFEVLGTFDSLDENDREKYEFRWKGKQEALMLAGKRSTGTLRPVPQDSVDWETTRNLYIEGDNLEVLKLLQTSYYRRVKMIYIDPPYNTGKDFVYTDNFADPLARYREVTQQTTKSNPESMGRFHTNWLNMMLPRLRLAANLLRDDGVIFISIDDGEVHNLRKLCDEIFGEEHFAAQIPWRKRTAKSDVPYGVSQDYEWILVYAKSDEYVACLEGGTRKYFETEDLPGKPWRIHDLTTQRTATERPNSNFTMVNPKTGEEFPVNPQRTWAMTQETFKQYYAENRIVFPSDYDFLTISKPAFRYFKEDDMAKAGDRFGYIPVSTNLPSEIGMTQDGTKEIAELFEQKVFGFPKPVALIRHLIKATTSASPNNDDIILDFFSGSATTAHAVMRLNAEDGGNRRFILVQLPEVCDENSEAAKAGYANICEIGKERIRRAGAKIREQRAGDREQRAGDREQRTGGREQYVCSELQRIDCMAKGNSADQRGLSVGEVSSENGDICTVGADEASSGINPVEHRRGTFAQLDQGVSQLSFDSARFEVGTGNTADYLYGAGLYSNTGVPNSDGTFGRNQQNDFCPNAETEICPLTPAPYPLDLGFRVFRLDSSNLKQWDNSPIVGEDAVEQFTQRLMGMLEILKSDRSDVDVVYEVMLKLGQDLCEPIVVIDLPGGRQVYGVGADVKFIVCLALQITVEDAAIMADYAPGCIVFADQCFDSSEAKSNVKLTLRDKGITIRVL